MYYPIHLQADSNGQLLVTFPDIPEAATAADTREQALKMAVDALETALDFYFANGRRIPLPSSIGRDQYAVSLSDHATARVLLHNELLSN
ncbi:MAG: type II toxin-antitoxin system HicB family antitoxin [Georgfuchsia sp.]